MIFGGSNIAAISVVEIGFLGTTFKNIKQPDLNEGFVVRFFDFKSGLAHLSKWILLAFFTFLDFDDG